MQFEGWERVAGDASRSQIMQALRATVRSSNDLEDVARRVQ